MTLSYNLYNEYFLINYNNYYNNKPSKSDESENDPVV
jgi:hypothetical protein